MRSMTGFGAGRGSAGGEEVSVEVRAVNHKFCEVKPRLPRELAALEAEVTRMVRERLHRGAVEVTVRRSPGEKAALEVKADLALAREYVNAMRSLQSALSVDGGVSVAALAQMEGVLAVSERPADLASATRALAGALSEALAQVEAMRDVEGAALGRDIGARLEVLEGSTQGLRALAPQAVASHHERLTARVAQLAGQAGVDPVRVAQEVAILADRSDISEELARLESHLGQFRAMAAASEPAGRRLDFLVQEMHREANTIGSKSQSAEITNLVVTIKAEIEKLREQVQNIE